MFKSDDMPAGRQGRRAAARLDDVPAGQRAVIREVSGTARFVSRVTSIGITEGCVLEVLQNVDARPVLVYARDSAIALDRDDCEHISVEVVA